nr:succinate dehydrogenase, cytochrome b556 subunit [Sphingomonas bacterium]
MTPVRARPLSPHIGIYRWGPHMTVSILHRATGTGMALVGLPLFTWWLAAIAAGPVAYARFVDIFTVASGRLNVVGWVVGVGLTLSLFQHMMTGIRHLVLDTGAGYELRVNKQGAVATMVASVLLTAIFWLWMGLR